MPGYEAIRAKIVQGTPTDGPGAEGPIGSFNHKGGKELVINYDAFDPDTGAPVTEEHHIVPYLIGKSRAKDHEDDEDASVRVLLAWKYKGPLMPPPAKRLGFRCYKVDKINLSGTSPATRPPLGPGDDDRKKLKLKRQSCVDIW